MSFIETKDGTRLFYRDWGTGRPIVFVSGWALSSTMWQYQMLELSKRGFRCIAYDRRGHGRSDDPGRGYDYDTLADDLRELLSGLALDDVTLVSHSMGSGELIRYLTRHGSAHIARLLLLAPGSPFLLRTASNPDGIPGELLAAVRAQWSADFPRWTAENAQPYVGTLPPPHAVSSELVEWTRADLAQTSLQAAVAFSHSGCETDFRDELRALRLPTLIIHGDKDQSNPIELCGKRMAQLIHEARLEIYEGAPHGLYMSHRDRLNRDLAAFANDPRAY